MKIAWINESFLSAKMREAIVSGNPQCKAAVTPDQPWVATSGHDSTPTQLNQPTGVPAKSRHRRYFGMEARPGTIRL